MERLVIGMHYKRLLWLSKAEAITLLLVICVYGANRSLWPGDCFNKLETDLCIANIQWLISALLLIILVRSVYSNAGKADRRFSLLGPYVWLLGAILAGAVVYILQYSDSFHTTQAVSWFGGAALGQSLVSRLRRGTRVDRALLLFTIVTLIIILCVGEVLSIQYGIVFKYHDHLRWSGLLDNPNIWGLLMGTGIVLAEGLALSTLLFLVFGETESICGRWTVNNYWNWIFVFLCFSGVILYSRGLCRSYSRGAWVATACGMAYLVIQLFKIQRFDLEQQLERTNKQVINSYNMCISWFQKKRFLFFVVLISVAVLTFWQFRHSKHETVTSRIYSAANMNDFSWRNRIAAWQGAFQIIAEHPWLGAGWNQPKPLYENYYLSPKLDESTAIEMNDYLLLGATLGVPVLFSFVMYIWLSLAQKSEVKSREPDLTKSDSGPWNLGLLQTACRAGAIALAVGFWFDGGLFKLATASIFWILLEMGRYNLRQTT